MALVVPICFLLVLLHTSKVSGVACPNGWTRHDTSCYFFVDMQESWEDASAHCEAFDSQLAAIETEREDVFIRNTLIHLHAHDSSPSVKYWTDGTDVATETEWIWAYSEKPILDYSHWCPNQPDNFNSDEDCMRLAKFCGFGWDDGNCESKHYFICERYDKDFPLPDVEPTDIGIIG
ncbi:perlucin-like [Mizuhopecten yessoensis]|uniref:perlucin-like n=1 Tax=Mizuhopecten yessoensis TaxID=6573 RepID=UPI000B457874|nr:perlucin-like [Mizuhopecten yessoensis]